ncbi:MAG: PilX N-terminal domain-containing pilus assembly protein [candidate division NC10 bacterium]|nr:PilX N-terminal domain-containing pilus assembly protein [candidate division NC10 bacterium]
MKAHGFKVLQQERGIVLILTMLVMVVMSILGLAFLTTARTEDTIAANYRNHTAAFYAAEGGVESGFQQLKANLAVNPNISDADLAKLVPAALTDPNYTVSPFQVRRIRPTPYLTTLDSGPYIGLNAMTTPYEVAATAVGPRGSRVRLTQRVNYAEIPLFQFMAFYGRGVDLEIAPSPPAVLTGRIHVNGNLHLKENLDTKFDGYITSAGDVYRYLKPYPAVRGQNVEIKDANGVYQELNFDHEYDYDFQNKWAESDWMKAALSKFGGRLQDSAMGVQEIMPPIPSAAYDPSKPDVSSHQLIEKGAAGDTPALKDAKMYYKADIGIENGGVKDKSGNAINLNAKGCDKNTITTKTFYDPREQQNMTVIEVDIGMMNACGVMPANGILYAYGDGAIKGIRLKNGIELPGPTPTNPNGGLTVASENPVYVMGDYNTVNKAPAAVMGDAIYILSNSWEKNGYDKKGKDPYTQRPAADTTVNAAVMLGPHAESQLGVPNGNGYFENIFRFLEDWRAGVPNPDAKYTFTYNGSIVSLWHSQQAKAPFARPDGVTYRTPPKRPWTYDTLFDTKIPPGTPMGIIYTRGQWSEG